MTVRSSIFAAGIFVLALAACGSKVDLDNDASGAASGADASSGAGAGGPTGAGGAGGAASLCPPGKDPNCNAYPGMTAHAGTCNADGTCTCNPGFDITTDGTCLNLELCAYGFVDSCNGNDTAPAVMGACNPDGTCTCNPGFVLDETDRCVSEVCHGGCPVEGETRCAGTFLQTCDGPGNNCPHRWLTTDHCSANMVCNTDATKCVASTGPCLSNTDCACGCACENGACACSGAPPPSCQVDADCGPVCAGLICVAGACQKASSHP